LPSFFSSLLFSSPFCSSDFPLYISGLVAAQRGKKTPKGGGCARRGGSQGICSLTARVRNWVLLGMDGH
jgi:hypothetical protein